MNNYRVNNAEEVHMGLKYKTGLVEDLRRCGRGFLGGIHFANVDILAFINFGPWIRQVTVPFGEIVYRAGFNAQEYKAQRVILGERRLITKEIVQELIDEGADVNAVKGTPLINALCLKDEQMIRLLLENGADPNVSDGEALRIAKTIGMEGLFRKAIVF